MIVRRRATLAALVAAPLVLLTSACNDGGGGSALGFGTTGGSDGSYGAAAGASTANAPSAESVTRVDPAAPAPDDGLALLTGAWAGTYHCAQGATSMRLSLVATSTEVTGAFEFTAGSVSGAYTVKGTKSGDQVVLHGAKWIKQPSGYVMVDFKITEISATTLSGSIDGAGCSTFRVNKS